MKNKVGIRQKEREREKSKKSINLNKVFQDLKSPPIVGTFKNWKKTFIENSGIFNLNSPLFFVSFITVCILNIFFSIVISDTLIKYIFGWNVFTSRSNKLSYIAKECFKICFSLFFSFWDPRMGK